MNTAHFEQQMCIAADHPSLPGHFPDQPLVPGVMLLEHVALALRAWRGQRIARVSEAKFVAPLLPDEQATVSLMETTTGQSVIRFEIRRGNVLLARGLVEGST